MFPRLMFDGWDHMGGWGWMGMGLMMLMFTALVVWAVWAMSHTHASEPHSSPIETLGHRYARGEIDEEEFHRRRETLTSGGSKQ